MAQQFVYFCLHDVRSGTPRHNGQHAKLNVQLIGHYTHNDVEHPAPLQIPVVWSHHDNWPETLNHSNILLLTLMNAMKFGMKLYHLTLNSESE